MIKVVIIEDEIPARNKMKRFLSELEQPTTILAELSSVSEGLQHLPLLQPDLILSDIELMDGTSFEIFNQCTILCPIIFTTAYDQYWMHAFDANGIAYLLKPFSKDQFLKAWNKYLLLRGTPAIAQEFYQKLMNVLEQHPHKTPYKKRFTVTHRKGIQFLEVKTIAFIEATQGIVIACDWTGKKHPLQEATLTEVENQVDPSDFFRINRSEILSKSFIERLEYHNKNAITIQLKGITRTFVTSQSKTAEFRKWIEA
jgi:DNA-binding LytR/AlgR family response regulator